MFANICRFNIIQTRVMAYTLVLIFRYFPRMGNELLKDKKNSKVLLLTRMGSSTYCLDMDYLLVCIVSRQSRVSVPHLGKKNI